MHLALPRVARLAEAVLPDGVRVHALRDDAERRSIAEVVQVSHRTPQPTHRDRTHGSRLDRLFASERSPRRLASSAAYDSGGRCSLSSGSLLTSSTILA